MKRSFEEDLKRSVAAHGHLCAGQVLGCRVARLGLAHFGIEEPETYRDLIVFVEADRCLADAVSSVTFCTLGKRRLKFHDQGKMAATFLDLKSGEAIRIYVKGDAHAGPDDDVIDFYTKFPDEEFFTIQNVVIDLAPDDLPGRPRHHAVCSACGEQIKDGREVTVEDTTLCKTCAGVDAYYRVIDEARCSENQEDRP